MSALNNPNLAAIEPLLYSAQEDIDTANGQLADALQTIAADNDIISTLNQKIAGLQSQLSIGSPSPLVTQFRNIEAMAGWIWPKGTQGNSGGTGNTGVASWAYDPVSGIVNATITPTLPKLATAPSGNYNAYFFNPLAGTDSNSGQPLAFPAISPKANVFSFHVEYFVTSANWAHRNALENEIRWHNGQGFRHVMASQLLLGGKPQVRIWDWQQKWVPTTIPCNMQPDSWYSIDTLFDVNPVTGATTCIGFEIEGKFYPWGKTQNPNPYTSHPAWFLASVQPDSDSAGDPFAYQVRNLHVTIL